jgi:SH3-like domain-containing protein
LDIQNSGWIHTSQLKKSSSVILIKDQFIFTKPSKFSKPLAIAKKGKLILLEKCRENWCKIKSKDISGWILFENFWGKLLN